MYLKLMDEIKTLMESAVEQAGYKADDMSLGESAHADVSSSLPFRLAKELKKNPMEISKDIVSHLGKSEYVDHVEVAGAYINFYASQHYVTESLEEILKQGVADGTFRSDISIPVLAALVTHTLVSVTDMRILGVRFSSEGISAEDLVAFCLAGVMAPSTAR